MEAKYTYCDAKNVIGRFLEAYETIILGCKEKAPVTRTRLGWCQLVVEGHRRT